MSEPTSGTRPTSDADLAAPGVLNAARSCKCGGYVTIFVRDTLGVHAYGCPQSAPESPVEEINPIGFGCTEDPGFVCDGTCSECEVNQ